MLDWDDHFSYEFNSEAWFCQTTLLLVMLTNASIGARNQHHYIVIIYISGPDFHPGAGLKSRCPYFICCHMLEPDLCKFEYKFDSLYTCFHPKTTLTAVKVSLYVRILLKDCTSL